MRNKKDELNKILMKYEESVQKVYQEVLTQEHTIKNIRNAQLKALINDKIMKEVQKDDN